MTAEARAVITGLGLVNPLGIGHGEVWPALLAGGCAIAPIRRFEADGIPVRLSAEVAGFRAGDHVPRRLIARSDRFSHYAMAAAQLAFDDARLSMDELDPFRVGICFGNNSGGWDICERGFEEYYRQGPGMVNPWQATAWFPTAPQGFVSIRYGVRGFSKSFACDRASGACALFYALRSIRWDHADVVLTGGAEAPITRLGLAAHVSTGELSRSDDPCVAYRPFDRNRSGLVVGEGSSVLVLERADRAQRRGARIYGEVLAVTQRTGEPADPSSLAGAMEAALSDSGLSPGDVDVVFGEGCGTVAGDRAEAAALGRVFGRRRPPVTVTKAAYGHLYGASFGTELACAMLAMSDDRVPGTRGIRDLDPECDLELLRETTSRRVDHVLVNATSREGTGACLVARRWQPGDRNTASAEGGHHDS